MTRLAFGNLNFPGRTRLAFGNRNFPGRTRLAFGNRYEGQIVGSVPGLSQFV